MYKRQCADYISNHFSKTQKIYIFCGNGNNGGDGFAIARMLYQKGFDVEVFVDKSNLNFSSDAKINWDRVKEISGIDIFDFEEFNAEIKSDSIIIDALFGSGLNRKIEGKNAEIIYQLNQIKAHKIAIDIPSGIFADEIFPESSVVFEADDTCLLYTSRCV